MGAVLAVMIGILVIHVNFVIFQGTLVSSIRSPNFVMLIDAEESSREVAA